MNYFLRHEINVLKTRHAEEILKQSRVHEHLTSRFCHRVLILHLETPNMCERQK